MTDYNDLITRLRSMDGIGYIQLKELMSRKTPMAAADAIAELVAKNARIIDLLGKKVVDSTMLADIGIKGGSLNATIEGGVAGLLASSFAEQFKDSGATNYLELSFHNEDLGDFVVTMQRKNGDTPAMQKSRAEARVAELQSSLSDVVGDLEMRSHLKRGEDYGLVDVSNGVYMRAKHALGEIDSEILR